MPTNYKNTIFYKIDNAKQTVPVSANGTGTISTAGTAVKGVSTLFKTEMQVGSWLTKLSTNELRKVVKVESNTLAYLSDAFAVDIAALTTPDIISHDDLNIREIGVIIPLVNSAGVAYAFGEIDGVVLESGLPISYGKTGNTKDDRTTFIDPIIANATSTMINVTILK